MKTIFLFRQEKDNLKVNEPERVKILVRGDGQEWSYHHVFVIVSEDYKDAAIKELRPVVEWILRQNFSDTLWPWQKHSIVNRCKYALKDIPDSEVRTYYTDGPAFVA